MKLSIAANYDLDLVSKLAGLAVVEVYGKFAGDLVGGGDCEIPLAVTQWATERGYNVRFTCMDHNPHVLAMAQETLRFSYETFRDYGNMSSPTVMFVVRKILNEASPRQNDRALLLSFGAGFTAFAALVEFL